MIANIIVKYIGDLRTEATHLDSNSKIITDAPKDNNGLGRKFSPTDLVVSSLSSCLLTIMGIVSKRHKIPMDDSFIEAEKIMGVNPRRIKEINLKIYMSSNIAANKMKLLKNAASHCPVHNSLSENMNIRIQFKSV